MASGSDRNTDARGKQGTEGTEKIFSSITTDKGQLNAPGRCPNNEQGCATPDSIGYLGNRDLVGLRGNWWDW